MLVSLVSTSLCSLVVVLLLQLLGAMMLILMLLVAMASMVCVPFGPDLRQLADLERNVNVMLLRVLVDGVVLGGSMVEILECSGLLARMARMSSVGDDGLSVFGWSRLHPCWNAQLSTLVDGGMRVMLVMELFVSATCVFLCLTCP